MDRKNIRKIVDTVCNSEWRCPVNEAGAACDCNGYKGECPFKKALELYADEAKKKGGRK